MITGFGNNKKVTGFGGIIHGQQQSVVAIWGGHRNHETFWDVMRRDIL